MLITSITIFLGAFLLFLVQPLTAQRMLPWFGGSPSVWIVSLLFFQSALLAGYLYAHLLASRLPRRWQQLLHLGVLFGALLFLPIGPSQPVESSRGPTADLLSMLVASLGLPLLVLSATSPMLQSWASTERVYRLYAVSNLGSLLGLWCYPFLVQPFSRSNTQVWLWSAGFALFAGLSAVAARRWSSSRTPSRATAVGPARRVLWMVLAASGSILLMATSNQLTRNVAAVPFLWVLPLSLYLLSFVLTFEHDRWYAKGPRKAWGALFLATLFGILHLLSLREEPDFALQLALYSANLIAGCVLCHGELYRLRPEPDALTGFYLHVALGGVLGGVLVSLVAPQVFRGYWEYPLGLGLVYLAGGSAMLRGSSDRREWILWALGALFLGAMLWGQVRSESRGALVMRRSFFGVLRVYDRHVNTRFWERHLWNGPVTHGGQLMAPGRRREPILYYSPDSGVGIALFHGRTGEAAGTRKIGVVGLGTGSLAAYAGPEDEIRFYEINPDVVEVAREYFSYLRDTEAKVDIVVGDARRSLQRELNRGEMRNFDLLIIDAFTGDAIPVHLLTREAFALYDAHLAPEGTLAVHVSNLHFDLKPVVRSHAESLGAVAVLVQTDADEERNLYSSDWVLVTRHAELIASASLQSRMTPWRADEGYRAADYAWTDDHSNLFEVMK